VWSKTIRTARSRTSGECLLGRSMGPILSLNGPSDKAGTLQRNHLRHRRAADWTVDGKRIDVGPGQALCIPRGVIHRFDNHGTHDVKALCAITPAAIGPQFFRESADLINGAAGGPPDRVEMIEVMRRHGLKPAP